MTDGTQSAEFNTITLGKFKVTGGQIGAWDVMDLGVLQRQQGRCKEHFEFLVRSN